MPSGEKKKITPKVISKDVTMRDKSQDRWKVDYSNIKVKKVKASVYAFANT